MDSGVSPGDAATDKDSGTNPGNDGGTQTGLTRSEKARVRFKGQTTLRNELSAALSIDAASLCKEVGSYDCFTVHQIPLRGVEPYTLGAYEPIDDTTVTTPLAVDRIVLSACRDRVTTDFGDLGNGLIFKSLSLGANGELNDPNAAEVSASIDTLYRRLLARHALADEVKKLQSLYADVKTANEPNPARAWAILSCFAVATSEESLFY
jgi:hypothetical protein